jgi:diacylglycerol kinase (ATP)
LRVVLPVKTTLPSGSRIAVITNPHARYSGSEIEAAFVRHAGSGLELEFFEIAADVSLDEMLQDRVDGISALVGVGGDGTISSIARLGVERQIPIGIIPGGSTNMIAKINGVPRSLDDAVALITGRHFVESFDAGRSGDRVLVHMGGAGFDAHLFERSLQGLKRRIGWMAYGLPAASAIRQPATTMTIRVDGNALTIDSRLVLVANSASLVHSGFRLVSGASRTDGYLDVLVFTANRLFPMARTVGDLIAMGRTDAPYLLHLRGRDISVESEPAVPYEIDGEVVGPTPFRVFVEPRALRMICGPSFTR